MKHKVKRALRNTFLVGFISVLPIMAMFYLKNKNEALKKFEPYELAPFYLQTDSGEGLGLHQLRNHISLIAVVPPNCTICSEEPSPFLRAEEWAKEHLTYKGLKKVSYQLIVVGYLDDALKSSLSSEWKTISVSKDVNEEFANFLDLFIPDQGEDLNDLLFLFADEQGKIQGRFRGHETSWSEISSFWSKITFNHYLQAHVSKRTFFGTKLK